MTKILPVALIGLLMVSTSFAQEELSDGKIRDMMEEYLSDRPTAERRREITESFRQQARRNMLRPYFARAATTESERALALQLATELQLDGLFKKIKKEIDSPDEAHVVKYLLTTQDGGAPEFLHERWEQAATDSPSFQLLADGFTQYLVPFDTVEKFYKYGRKKETDADRLLSSTKIVLWQMGMDADESQADIERTWKEFSRQNVVNAKTFPMGMQATEVIPVEEFHRSGRIRQVAKNYELLPGASMEWTRIPEGWQHEVFFLKLRMRAISGNGSTVTIETESHTQGIEVRAGKWVAKGASGRSADVDPEAWEEVVIFCQYNPKVEGQQRKGVVTIENKLTVTTGAFNGRLTRIRIAAGEDGTICIGNLHIQKQRGTKDASKRK